MVEIMIKQDPQEDLVADREKHLDQLDLEMLVAIHLLKETMEDLVLELEEDEDLELEEELEQLVKILVEMAETVFNQI
ncbi:MAG: hypothetical protein CMF74_16475 [Maricaulis sp.]|jgi:hypothetical protein|nr:hypothetical protein [Maricaulis sp.]